MFYYYGAKNQLAKYYPKPRYKLIIEPFAGSAAYSMYHLSLDNSLSALLIEKDERVFAAWAKLLNSTPEDILSYPVPNIGEQTQDFLVMTCGVSNATSKCKSMKFTPRIAEVFEIQRRRILRLLSLKDRIRIIHGDYREVASQEACWFIDPPYQLNAVNPKTIFANGNGYSKLCNSDKMDFKELGGWCESREGQVIVCEKNGAGWLDFKPFYEGKTSLNGQYKEVIWEK